MLKILVTLLVELFEHVRHVLRPALESFDAVRDAAARPDGGVTRGGAAVDSEPLHEVRMERVRDGVLEGPDGLFGGRRVPRGESSGALVLRSQVSMRPRARMRLLMTVRCHAAAGAQGGTGRERSTDTWCATFVRRLPSGSGAGATAPPTP